MKCNKCGNDSITDMLVVDNGPHKEVICRRCIAHIKFVSKKEAKRMMLINGQLTK